ncbi:MAG: beta-ketoacyl synthase N-terminal-like domain-containing protein, partial [Gemmatirosa sp.]
MKDADAQRDTGMTATGIAIVGMAGRFPGARDVDEFWANLRAGTSSIQLADDASLEAAGVPDAERRAPRYVRAVAELADVEAFDAEFFGVDARDAALMDPQHRHFVECTWEAMESAGHVAARFPGVIGVFAGCGFNGYLPYHLLPHREMMEELGFFHVRHAGNDKDFLAARASYLLDLTGPSINVQTACSTSLVAVHLACQSLLAGECELALAGGVTILVPHGRGYRYREGELLSPDGRCRAFSADAAGTVFGSGVGVVALRRLSDAMADGDTIYAVIRGSAVNNDGARKASYRAPSIDGQARVIAEALAVAGVEPASISYVEAHGTGTLIGDALEAAALAQALAAPAREPCAIGSVKPNIGHLDTAAGVASLIKVALALRHRELPPSLHGERANPGIDWDRGTLRLHTRLAPWTGGATPRRAGVTSIGIGGTNAHVVLEEAPVITRPSTGASTGASWQLLVLSARTAAELELATDRLVRHLAAHPELSLGDVAYTLQDGRTAFAHRRAVVCRDCGDVVAALGSRDPARVRDGVAPPSGVSIRAVAVPPAACEGGEVARLEAIARRWLGGDAVAWGNGPGERRRVPLPTYPFARQRHWIDAPRVASAAPAVTQSPVDDQTPPAVPRSVGRTPSRQAAAFAPPRDEIERTLVPLWEQLLGTAPVGLDDNIFDLGGSSLLAATLLSRVQETYCRMLPIALLYRAPTVRELAEALRHERSATQAELVVIMQEGAVGRTPFFLIPDAGGHVFRLRGVTAHLDPEQPVIGLQMRGLDGREPPARTIEQAAADCLARMRAVQPEGPYALGGLSYGGLVAYEVARRMMAEGEPPPCVVLFDSSVAAPARSGAPAAVRRTLDRLRRAARAVARGDAGPVRRRLASLAERQTPGAANQHAGVAAERSLLEVMHDVLQVNYAAAARYRPLTYPG